MLYLITNQSNCFALFVLKLWDDTRALGQQMVISEGGKIRVIGSVALIIFLWQRLES